MSAAPSSELLERLFGSAVSSEAFHDRARLQGMLDFEAALARVEARLGIIPPASADAIARRCRAELFDVPALARAAARAGNPAIPTIAALTDLVAAEAPDAARHVHWGATSQDVMDTGFVLQLRPFLQGLADEIDRLSAALARLAEAHKLTVLPGRTLLQHAAPITLGLKMAGLLDAVERHAVRLQGIRSRSLVLQFGGAVGTLAALGDRGLEVAEALARELELPLPEMPWHSNRDRFAEVATVLGLLIGTLGKLARDVSLLMQTEVAEAFEPPGEGRGGSSTMPQKRNPVGAAAVLAAAVRAPGLVSTLLSAMVQEHERGVGGWHAEWQTLPDLCALAGGALQNTIEVIEGLEVHPERMRANLDATRGQILAEAAAMALAPLVGKPQAHQIVERASRRARESGRRLQEVLLGDDPVVAQHFSPARMAAVFDPETKLGAAAAFVDRVLARRQRRLEAR